MGKENLLKILQVYEIEEGYSDRVHGDNSRNHLTGILILTVIELNKEIDELKEKIKSMNDRISRNSNMGARF